MTDVHNTTPAENFHDVDEMDMVAKGAEAFDGLTITNEEGSNGELYRLRRG